MTKNNSQQQYKVRLGMKGFNQKKCINFEEIFSHVVQMSFIRVVLGLTANLNLEIEQLDVKKTFLHGDLEKKQILQRHFQSMFMFFGGDRHMIQVYTDVDMARDIDSRKSLSGYLLTFARGAVSCWSRLQQCVALSTIEVEYMYIAITEGCKETLWMKNFLQEISMKQDNYVVLCDSQSVIHLAKNSAYHLKSMHIDVRYHWIQDIFEKK